MIPFPDQFSAVATGYARYRPRYPRALFTHLAAVSPARDRAWDCGTGNGQAAVALADYFGRVLATDASAEQIAQAEAHPGVEYRVAPAEAATPFEAARVDLVTVAQALHWFDRPRFYAQVRRVLRPGGVIAAWTYARVSITDSAEASAAIDDFHDRTVGPYWPPQRALVDSGYRNIDFPFREIEAPDFAMVADLDLHDLLGYIGTWSSVGRYRRVLNRDPLPDLARRLESTWGDPARRRTARWPLRLRMGVR